MTGKDYLLCGALLLFGLYMTGGAHSAAVALADLFAAQPGPEAVSTIKAVIYVLLGFCAFMAVVGGIRALTRRIED